MTYLTLFLTKDYLLQISGEYTFFKICMDHLHILALHLTTKEI